MKIFVKAKPGSKATRIERVENLFSKPDEIHLIVAVAEPASDGRANRAIEKAVAVYLKVAPSRVRIVRGMSSRQKTLEVEGL